MTQKNRNRNKTMRLKGIVTVLMLMASFTGFAQSLSVQRDSVRMAKYKDTIGLDLTVRDYETKRIDAKIMGQRLAGILDYLMENYQQGIYDRKLSSIACEQNETLENAYIQIKKLKFVNAVKKGNELTVLMRADLQKNAANVKLTDITFHFIDGLSESERTNELFSYMSHYLQAEVLIDKL